MCNQRVAHGLERGPLDMRTHKERAAFDPLLPPRRLCLIETGVLERTGDTSRKMSGSFSDRGRQRSVGDNWTNTGHHNPDGSDQVCAKLAQARSCARILYLGSGRRARGVRDLAFLVMRPSDDGNALARNTELAQVPGSVRRGTRIVEQGHNEGVRH